MGLMGGGKFVARTCINLILIVQICQICLPSHGETDVRVNLVTPELMQLHFEDCKPNPSLINPMKISLPEKYTFKSRSAEIEIDTVKRTYFGPRQGKLGQDTSTNIDLAKNKTIGPKHEPASGPCKMVAKTRSATYYINIEIKNNTLDFGTLGPLMRRGEVITTGQFMTNGLMVDEANYTQLESRAQKWVQKNQNLNLLTSFKSPNFDNEFFAVENFVPSYRLYMKDSFLFTCHDLTEECSLHPIPIDGLPEENRYNSSLSTFYVFKEGNPNKFVFMALDLTGRLVVSRFTFDPPSVLKFSSPPSLFVLAAVTPGRSKPANDYYTDLIGEGSNVIPDKWKLNLHKAHIESIYYNQSSSRIEWIFDSWFQSNRISDAHSGKAKELSNQLKNETKLAAHQYVSSDGTRYYHEVFSRENDIPGYYFTVNGSMKSFPAPVKNIPSDITGYNSPKCNKTITIYDFVYTIHNYDQPISDPTSPLLLKGLRFRITAAAIKDNQIHLFAGFNKLIIAPISMPDKCDQIIIDWSKAQESGAQAFIDTNIYDTQPDPDSIVNTELEFADSQASDIKQEDKPRNSTVIDGPSSKTGSKTVTVIIVIAAFLILVITVSAIYLFCFPCSKKAPQSAKPRKSTRRDTRNTDTVRSQLSNGASKINQTGPAQPTKHALDPVRSHKSQTSQGHGLKVGSKVGSRMSPLGASRGASSPTQGSLKDNVNKSTSSLKSGKNASGSKIASPKLGGAKSALKRSPSGATSSKLHKSRSRSPSPSPNSLSGRKSAS